MINDFLIKLSENPQKEHLNYLRDLIENLNSQILEKVKINLIFNLGEIGRIISLDAYYLSFMYETYHRSDRWVRNELIQAFEKISNKSRLSEKIIFLVGNALNDDYEPIQYNALEILKKLESFPDSIFRNIFYLLNSHNSKIIERCREVFDETQINKDKLYRLLNKSENYKILNPRAFRSLLLIQFKSLMDLESFRDKILGSDWEERYKENFLKEIDIYERILVKNI